MNLKSTPQNRGRLRLPYELFLLIVELCPPSSLATLCRVSFDLLLVAGPKLYRDISLTSLGALGKLFYESKVSSLVVDEGKDPSSS